MQALFTRLATFVPQNDSILHQTSSAITMATRIVDTVKPGMPDY
jgi:hypothetical protein